MSLAAGTRLGPYEVLGLIGAGGMGEVYKAKDTRLDRTVAIKVLPPQFADPEHRARFEREARTIATLSHPHICTLHDVGEHASSLFLVMEHLAGETLAERLRKGALPIEQALDIGAQIAEALSAAHRAGIVHRDLKPANVMLTKSGVKLLDFGLAKLKRPALNAAFASATLPTQSEPLTGRGTIVGTLHYMAPEQLEGKEADARSDIWALGCVIYEMASGERAFAGNSEASLIAAIISAEPRPLRSLQPLAPAGLDVLVRDCLAKDPDERWQSARDLERELRRSPEEMVLQPMRRKSSSARWAATLTVVASLGAAAGAMLAWRFVPVPQAAAGSVAHFVIQLPPGDSLDPGLRPALALSPDGSKLVYAATRQGNSHLFLRRLDQVEPILLSGTEGATGPFFSPDGQSVGFVASGKLMKTAIEGGVPVTLAEAPSGRGAAWAEDGTILFSAAPGIGLWRVTAAGGAVSVVSRLDLTTSDRTHRWPDVLPGGAAALMTVRGGEHVSFDQTSIVALSVKSGERGKVLERGTQPRYVRSGHMIFARAGALHAIRFDPVGLSVAGAPVAVVENVITDPSTGAAQYAVSANGVLAYVHGPDWVPQRTVLWIDRQGRAEPALDRSFTYSTPRVSPDGRRVAVVVEGASDNVWVVNSVSHTSARLTFETGSHIAPVWTPDGHRIAFASNAFGAYNLFWKNADGSDTAERLTDDTHIQFPSSWSPDGDLLAFTQSDPKSGSDIWVLSMKDGHKVRPLVQTQFNEHGAAFSPDGRWLAYCSNESGREEIYVQPFPGPGEKRQISSEGGREPVWSRRGDALFYRNANRIMAVAISDGSTVVIGHAIPVAEGDYVSSEIGGAPSYDVSPDGRRLLLMRESRMSGPSSIDVILNWFEVLKAKVPVK